MNKRLTKEDVNNRLFDLFDGEYEVIDENYYSVNNKTLFEHHLQDGSSHPFYAIPYNVFKGCRCGVCSGKIVLKGYNDLNTVRPDLVQYLVNKEDGEKVTGSSNKKIKHKCKNCGYELESSVYHFTKDEVSCPACSDGVSYPNKFMLNLLLQVEDQIDYFYNEWSPDWCKFILNGVEHIGIYDFYVSINNNKYIIEMDGAIGHGNTHTGYVTNVEESIERDRIKDNLAREHGIKVIRIDCAYYDQNLRYEYVKENIINSELVNILSFDNVDFDGINEKCLCSNIILAANLWNNGLNTKEIGAEIKVSPSTTLKYLKQATKFGFCNYTGKEGKLRYKK